MQLLTNLTLAVIALPFVALGGEDDDDDGDDKVAGTLGVAFACPN